MNIGKSIKELRLKKNISQGEFAKKCGISQTSISQIENGVTKPSSSNIKKICKILNVPETILYIKGMDESDIDADKKDTFKELFPIIEVMINRFV